MGIAFEQEKRIFTLNTKTTTYQFQIDEYGFLCVFLLWKNSLWRYGLFLLTYYDRGFSANPYDSGLNRKYSMDALPRDFAFRGTGDFSKQCACFKEW